MWLVGNFYVLFVGDVEELMGSFVVVDFEFDLLVVLFFDYFYWDFVWVEVGYFDGFG